MRISFIIPAYNAANTIVRAIKSIRCQRDDQFAEIIVVDDCSTDNTFSVASAMNKEGVVVARTTANSGPGVARNLGIELAQGDWIGFLDSDDELVTGSLDRLAEGITLANRPHRLSDILALDWCYAPVDVIYSPCFGEGREDLALLTYVDRDGLIVAYLDNQIDQSAIFHVYRRDFLRAENIGYRGGFHEDVDFTFHAFLLARGVQPVSGINYCKLNRPGSIVNTLGCRHINGYLDAVERIFTLLVEYGAIDHHRTTFSNFLVNVVASRLARLVRNSVEKVESVENILNVLHKRVEEILRRHFEIGLTKSNTGNLETRYYKMFQRLMVDKPPFSKSMSIALLKDLEELQRKSWSCYDLHHAVFLAPDEIRTCCKRYFYNGQMKGDVVLLKGDAGGDFRFGFDDILRAKNTLHRDINRNAAPQCEGCPFLVFSEWGQPLNHGIRYLSLEYHSVCNMRCTYCNSTYYGGKKPAYNVAHTVKSLGESGALSECEYLVWGGGEPTLDREFIPIAKEIANFAPKVRQRIITNSTKYLPQLATMMTQDQAFIVVSIDAGTDNTFKQIRQFKNFGRVIENLQHYNKASPKNLIIKYIVMPENSGNSELVSFINRIALEQLLSSNFQISCDFRLESLALKEIVSLAQLYIGLYERGAGFIFIDDLVWQRLPTISQSIYTAIKEHLNRSNWIADASEIPKVAVWGTGTQAQLFMEKSAFLNKTRVVHFVDPRPTVIGTKFLGYPVLAPDSLKENDLPIVIATVQSAPLIFHGVENFGLNQNRIIKKLIL